MTVRWKITGILAAAAVVAVQAANPVPAASGKVSGGFKAPVFDERGELKTQFEGEGFRPQKDGRYLITKFVLKTFKARNQPDLTALADECFFRPTDNSASSPGVLKVRQAGGRFELQGEGFEWRQQTGRLLLSNRVQTLIRERAGAGETTNDFEVKSDQLDFDSRLNIAVFSGAVTAVQTGRLAMSCGSLTVRLGADGSGFERIDASNQVTITMIEGLEQHHISGDLASFLPGRAPGGEERLEVRGHGAWRARQYEGKAEEIILAAPGRRKEGSASVGSTNISFEAKGEASVRVPRAEEESGKPARWIDVRSREYAYRDGRVAFRGDVQARSETEWNLSAEKLDVVPAEGSKAKGVDRIIAEDSVRIDILDPASPGSIRGGRAEFKDSDGSLTVERDPQWRLRNFRGSGEKVTMKVRSKEPDVVVTGKSVLILPGEGLAASGLMPDLAGFGIKESQARRPATAAPIEVQSAGMTLRGREAVFLGPVLVSSATGRLDADSLGVRLDAGGNRVERLAAEGHVALSQGEDRFQTRRLIAELSSKTNRVERLVAEGDVQFFFTREGRFTKGRGDRLHFASASQQASLEGKPRISTETGITIEGDEPVQWDVATRKFRTRNYRISGTRDSFKKPEAAALP